MHRFWEIEEMVRLLASDLEKRCEAPSSAIALACCSKRLSGIVLDSLWEVLPDGLRSLMECLPPETWEIRNDEFVRTTLVRSHFRGLTQSTGLLTLPLYRGVGPVLELCS